MFLHVADQDDVVVGGGATLAEKPVADLSDIRFYEPNNGVVNTAYVSPDNTKL